MQKLWVDSKQHLYTSIFYANCHLCIPVTVNVKINPECAPLLQNLPYIGELPFSKNLLKNILYYHSTLYDFKKYRKQNWCGRGSFIYVSIFSNENQMKTTRI